jgi:hypothetical protein
MRRVKIISVNEDQLNAWLAAHPNVNILEFRPFPYGAGDTAVLILYDEPDSTSGSAAPGSV